MKVLILDICGMIGHVVALWMKEHGHDVYGYGDKANDSFPVICGSLFDTDALQKAIAVENFDAVINCAAIINQDAERDKASAVFINAYLPHFLEKVTEGTKTVVVHRGTDCVFSGERGQYTVEDTPDAQSFYARTKALGALVNEKDITIRTSLIGPETDPSGNGLFNWFNQQYGKINGYRNAIWTGITTVEFAKEIEYLLNNHAHGLFQCVPAAEISKYDLLRLFQKYFSGHKEIIPFDNRRLDKSLIPNVSPTGLAIPGYDDMIREMAEWIAAHPSLYPHYQVKET